MFITYLILGISFRSWPWYGKWFVQRGAWSLQLDVALRVVSKISPGNVRQAEASYVGGYLVDFISA